MPENSQATQLPPKIQFIEYHRPTLKLGDYEISVKQTIKVGDKHPDLSKSDKKLKFTIAADRFSGISKDVKAVFPPVGSLGDHSNVLPHIVLKRSTHLWERHAFEEDKSIPWLVLLVFDEDEISEIKTKQLSLKKLQDQGLVELDKHEDSDDKTNVIQVPKELLQKIMPSTEELKLQAHVRQGEDNNGKPIGEELAVLVSNRLPKFKHRTTVHLVSVEHRFDANGFKFDDSPDPIKLVSLKQWNFTCVTKDHCYMGLWQALNTTPITFRLPHNDNADAEQYLAAGYVPLKHHTQDGNDTVSWYRSPLIPGDDQASPLPLPAHTAKDLIQTNSDNNLEDVTYAVAWELGRALTLQNKQVSVELFNWKRQHIQNRKQQQQQQSISHLPHKGQYVDPTTQTSHTIVQNWFDKLRHLEGVPFNYLVPKESMLPVESIRFCQVDPLWVDCLLDGAFSVGRVTADDHEQDKKLKDIHPKSSEILGGFLLRSSLVHSFGNDDVDFHLRHNDRDDYEPPICPGPSSPNFLLALFPEKLTSLEVIHKPERLHFGVDESTENEKTVYKKKSRLDDTEHNVPWKGDADNKVIDLVALAQALNAPKSDQFAYQMIEGVPKIRYEIS